jgi:DoxX-like protein
MLSMSRLLWVLQALLAAVFLFSGTFKLALPIDVIQQQLPLPELYIRAIGVIELLGAIGLVLPALLRIQPVLTPLAAAGLVILMAGATLLTPSLTGGDVSSAALPLVLGLLSAFVAYGRARRAPIAPRQPRATLRLAAR